MTLEQQINDEKMMKNKREKNWSCYGWVFVTCSVLGRLLASIFQYLGLANWCSHDSLTRYCSIQQLSTVTVSSLPSSTFRPPTMNTWSHSAMKREMLFPVFSVPVVSHHFWVLVCVFGATVVSCQFNCWLVSQWGSWFNLIMFSFLVHCFEVMGYNYST